MGEGKWKRRDKNGCPFPVFAPLIIPRPGQEEALETLRQLERKWTPAKDINAPPLRSGFVFNTKAVPPPGGFPALMESFFTTTV